ncbi:MAG TPA: family 10 glycosylhydrolase [Candidatus Onthousia faecavium]|nr:family 10 glycosylhydrolase [Candidatus Onthousia faecavium]
MKREYYLIIIIIFLLLIYIFIPSNKDTLKEEQPKEKRAIFISYIELNNYLKGKSKENIEKTINNMIDDVKNFGFNMILLQVRSFSDAIYPSKIFPSSRNIVATEGDELPMDVLAYFIEKSHQEKVELHAWVNPYRISTKTDISSISAKNPAYSLLNTNAVAVIPNYGIYYNPASKETEELILEGIEEIITNYKVDGIHFDDYFYPKSSDIDKENYQKALEENPNLTLTDYRLSVTTSLIKKTYDLIKKYNKDILFGISPDGNMENNYSSNYIDTRLFATKSGYIDYLMPQVYYGFLNSVKPFEETVKSWDNLITNDIDLIPALAFYKTGNVDTYAKEGANEWILYNNIISREVLISRNLSNYDGFAIFRYDSLFNKNLTASSFAEKENLKNVLLD